MKKRIEVEMDAQTIQAIDAERGELSRAEYLDRLLKRSQGVTQHHTPDRDSQKRKLKKIGAGPRMS
jgi:hypothetical protein